MLIDRATIFVRSGKGGDGCLSFRREKFIPKGGPDGGDGGKGGDVVLVGDRSLTTLLPLTPHPHKRAKNGNQGTGRSMHGANGEDCIVPVPLGTLVHDKDTMALLVDIGEHDQRFVAARGGSGGLGNEHFKSATNQTPRETTPGEPREESTLLLELKLIADVGLIGLPNAGKSTMLRAVSRAMPKVADYPFTTLQPHLGIADLPGHRRLVVADIPGLIRGAAEGAGLGHDFLRHIERTKVLVHLLDIAPIDGSDPVENYRAIRAELADYAEALIAKPQIIALNKIDLLPESEREETARRFVQELGDDLGDQAPMLVSGATGQGVAQLVEQCWTATRDGSDQDGWQAG